MLFIYITHRLYHNAVLIINRSFIFFTEPEEKEEDQITIDYHRGLPRITVPLPSRNEKCRFTLKPISNTVGDLTTMIQHEDRGVDRVMLSTKG